MDKHLTLSSPGPRRPILRLTTAYSHFDRNLTCGDAGESRRNAGEEGVSRSILREEWVQFSLLVAEFVRKYLGDGNLIQRVFVHLRDGGYRIWCKHVPRRSTNFSSRQSSKWHVDLIV